MNGKLLREIEAGDGKVMSHSGISLDFENDEPGHDIAEEGEGVLIIFDSGDIDLYNANVGIPAEVYQDFDSGWHNFILEMPETKSKDANRAWWKFW